MTGAPIKQAPANDAPKKLPFGGRAPWRVIGRRPPFFSGPPFPGQHAKGKRPLIDFGLAERSALKRIREAGAEGVAIGDDLSVSLAIRLGLTRMVVIDKASPQRVRLKRFAKEPVR